MSTTEQQPTITVAHSPDSDDAFMHYALAEDKIPSEGITFTHLLKDIETLNQWALEGRYEVSAVSIHAYAYLADRYALLPHGASMGNKYGPIVVAREPVSMDDLRGKRVAIPGRLTTAYLALQLAADGFEPVEVPFDQIIDAVKAGTVDAGLLIHEGQLTYGAEGLHKVLDLGEWWFEETGLQLPLGGNAIRKDLGPELTAKVSRLLHESIRYALENREERAREPRGGARLLDAVRARPARAPRRPLRRHVRQRRHARLRRRRPPRRPAPARPGLRAGVDPEQGRRRVRRVIDHGVHGAFRVLRDLRGET
jgi:1,4-dihydroxy-6-naphthoate synthase